MGSQEEDKFWGKDNEFEVPIGRLGGGVQEEVGYVGVGHTGEMSGWGLEVIKVIKQEIIWTKARQNKCSGYSGEEERVVVVGMKTI